MKKYLFLVFFVVFALLACKENQEPVTMKVWEGNPPTSNGLSDQAEIIVYKPKTMSKLPTPAVLICPGGGYAGLSMPYEGHGLAQWMASKGVVGVILKYRLPNKHKEVPFDDACQALQIIRNHSKEWNIDVSKIGVAGSSAGGHLAATLSTYYTNNELCPRPAFTILFYPVITMETVTKGKTRDNLMGVEPSEEDILAYSPEKQVSENTPPAIIFTADGDGSVPPLHSVMYYRALKEKNIPASLHIFSEGDHGWLLLPQYKYTEPTMSLLETWMESYIK
ncbi:alpha/beta hydrolase [Dysgonomonas macrotermitis]|uniref:Acetyl esterase/lipase n=1 Tax=Dysgonomonas macrotermitis TaxID=1346286 RepID=A0A1M5I6F0_9BACT|nr:alpha/beta hydrolase [Dysgonomonas macrotermitis]SHG23490.1 Acetyl esterase/lipase [Dysgonomonas macrotermitis]